MKKIEFVCIMALLIAFAGLGEPALGAYSSAANLDIYVANITPSPVEPGSDLTVSIILKNSGSANSINTDATLKAAYPFTVKTIQNEVRGRNICIGCSTNIIYSLSVDPSAKSGAYPVEFEATRGTEDSKVTEQETVNINVIGSPRITFKTNISDKITPNSAFGVDFEFENIGTGNAKDVKITTESSDFVISGGAPVISSLNSGEAKKASINFASSPNLLPNVYSVPILMSYIDELGKPKESTSSFGISVLGNSDLIVKSVKIEPTSVYFGDDFTVTVRVQNIGYGDAKEVVMELNAPYTGYKKAFIGKLAKDEDAPAIFSLKADSSSSDAKLVLKYRDDFGAQEKTESISINISKISNNTTYYIILAIACVAAYTYRKKIMKRLANR